MTSVSVIICAHNEERAIGALLGDVFAQRIPDGWTLHEVLVVADGCTDSTVQAVRSVAAHEPQVRLMELQPPNRGKSRAFNAGIVSLHDDIVVMLDDDIRIHGSGMLERLTAAIGGGVVLASGNDIPEPGPVRTWGHAAAMGRHLIKQGLKHAVMPCPNVYSCVGRVLAMHRSFYEGRQMPDIMGEDNFRYFSALREGLPYAYVPDAIVFFTPARTVADYAQQHARFWHGVDAIRERFGADANYGSPADWARVVVGAALCHPTIMGAWVAAALVGHATYWWQRHIARTPQTGLWERASSTT